MGRVTLVTGGAGFIGANYVLRAVAQGRRIVNLDALTYAGNLDNLRAVAQSEQHIFVRGDIGDAALIRRILQEHQPSAIVNFAAESHVDRSIDNPASFIQTNVVGTHTLLSAALEYWSGMAETKESFRFLHVSTDEVFGSLGPTGLFSETTPYAPNSPYAASKAAADHLVRAYFHTFGLPVLTTNCSNNYGPYQFPEKLIPLMILRALRGEPMPVYGDGANIRDWLFVEDHCRAIDVVLEKGLPGETYNVGGENERTNLAIVTQICELLDEFRPAGAPHKRLITYVKDRPGHDRRYAINASKIHRMLGWRPSENFESGLRKTVAWYLQNTGWVDRILSGNYRLERLGLGGQET